ncbi:serine/threonine-protein kinase [Alienimonas californiensis]|uniref:Serine/threonine-protein kinase PrkC n=1 Tax=Alienimonas californiensis TaxID=2527989 RepID=A0A517P8Q4_9PLAN|nr:serine/threonine-protein kinase [Alienimonas californiensis]QDT15759.1 Serine/threonine-protein kinase PrkC [Alienimonas californiensis]
MAWFLPKKPSGPAKTVKELAKRLTDCGLIEQKQFDVALSSVPASKRTPEALIDALEEAGTLTNFQAELARNGEIETLVIGGYKLIYRNAAGAFARVYRAEDKNGRSVALKVLRGRHASDPRQVAAFEKEARMAAKLDHPNVVPIRDVGEDDGRHYFAMDFIEGGNLRDFLTIRGKLSPKDAVGIALDIAEGLAHAARYGITHRDLKPGNVLFDTTGNAKLVDFGLGGEGDEGADLRAVEYSTLEKATQAPRDDPRSDLFFLGSILYELLTGVPPWPATAVRSERNEVGRYRDVTPIVDLAPDLPPAVVSVVGKLMAWRPTARYQTAAEAAGALRTLAASLDDAPAAEEPDLADDSSDLGLEDGGDRPLPKLLLVENRPSKRGIVSEYLSNRGFEVTSCDGADDALALIELDPPDAVLLMGDALGDDLFGLFGTLKAQGVSGEPLAVVALVTAAQAKKKNALHASGTCRVLAQPASLRMVRAELFRALKRVLSESRLIRLRDYAPSSSSKSASSSSPSGDS